VNFLSNLDSCNFTARYQGSVIRARSQDFALSTAPAVTTWAVAGGSPAISTSFLVSFLQSQTVTGVHNVSVAGASTQIYVVGEPAILQAPALHLTHREQRARRAALASTAPPAC
jgi:hypothetical protein